MSNYRDNKRDKKVGEYFINFNQCKICDAGFEI